MRKLMKLRMLVWAVVMLGVFSQGCAYLNRQANSLMDLVYHPTASFKQHWEVVERAVNLQDEQGKFYGVEFKVIKAGRRDEETLLVFVPSNLRNVLEKALLLSRGQFFTMEGRPRPGAEGFMATSITPFKVRRRTR